MRIKTKYSDEDVELRWGKYGNGQNALELYASEPILRASVSLPITIPANHILIKNWSENEGVLEALIKAKVISPVIRSHPTGYVEAYECAILKGNGYDII